MKKDTCTFEDFLKLDIRVGEVKSAVFIQNSNKLLEISVDLGTDYGTVIILSGIAKHIKPEEIIGKKLPIVANLGPKKMAGKESHGFILMADLDDHTPILLQLPLSLKNGTVIC